MDKSSKSESGPRRPAAANELRMPSGVVADPRALDDCPRLARCDLSVEADRRTRDPDAEALRALCMLSGRLEEAVASWASSSAHCSASRTFWSRRTRILSWHAPA